MASNTATVTVYGSSIVDNPSVSTNSGGGHGGTATLQGGTQVFQSDDIVVIEVQNVNGQGEVTGGSRIVSVTVYENATAYYHGVAKYTYGPMNPGQSANIQADVSGLGDTYMRFNANVLVSSTPGAPRLNQLFVAPDVDLAAGLANGGRVTFGRNTDMDYDHNGQIHGGLEQGNGNFNGAPGVRIVICLTRGTRIDTPRGPVPIEELEAGDLVTTLDHGPQPIRWIGARRVTGRGSNCPVRIRAGALGNMRDLRVSPNHRMLLSGPQAELLFGTSEVLVAAKFLVDDRQVLNDPCDEVEYFHFLFDGHQIVFAEGAPTESLYPGRVALDALGEASRAEILALFPELAGPLPGPHLSRYAVSRGEATALARRAG